MCLRSFAAVVAVCVWAAPLSMAMAADEPASRVMAAGRNEIEVPADPLVLGVLPKSPAPQEAQMRWEIRSSDVTLAKTLERWAATASHRLKWDAARNFLIGASDVYIGSFEGAVEHLLSSPGIRLSDYPLEACIYANTPPLIRITRQGEQSRECAAVTTQ
jgi:Toxin co-regulated pilus biosynthesis protein Q